MDFLRLEGEADFLMFLPPAERRRLTDYWYRGVTGGAKETIATELEGFAGVPKIPYRTTDPKKELLALLEARVGRVVPHAFELEQVEDGSLRSSVERLVRVKGRAASLLPEMSFVTVTEPDGARTHFTILRDSAHTNVAHLFHEDERRVPAEDELTVVHGFLGAYPNALFEVPRKDLEAFVDAVATLERRGRLRSAPSAIRSPSLERPLLDLQRPDPRRPRQARRDCGWPLRLQPARGALTAPPVLALSTGTALATARA